MDSGDENDIDELINILKKEDDNKVKIDIGSYVQMFETFFQKRILTGVLKNVENETRSGENIKGISRKDGDDSDNYKDY